MSGITLALSKGRIFDETLPLLAAAGITPSESPETSRKLIIGTNRPDVRLIIVRATDVPTYVQHGAADLGIAGKDVLIEHGGEGLYQPVDLNIARCRMMVATPVGFDWDGDGDTDIVSGNTAGTITAAGRSSNLTSDSSAAAWSRSRPCASSAAARSPGASSFSTRPSNSHRTR